MLYIKGYIEQVMIVKCEVLFYSAREKVQERGKNESLFEKMMKAEEDRMNTEGGFPFGVPSPVRIHNAQPLSAPDFAKVVEFGTTMNTGYVQECADPSFEGWMERGREQMAEARKYIEKLDIQRAMTSTDAPSYYISDGGEFVEETNSSRREALSKDAIIAIENGNMHKYRKAEREIKTLDREPTRLLY